MLQLKRVKNLRSWRIDKITSEREPKPLYQVPMRAYHRKHSVKTGRLREIRTKIQLKGFENLRVAEKQPVGTTRFRRRWLSAIKWGRIIRWRTNHFRFGAALHGSKRPGGNGKIKFNCLNTKYLIDFMRFNSNWWIIKSKVHDKIYHFFLSAFNAS